MLPILATGASTTLGFSEREVGTMSLAILVGSGVSALIAGSWVRSVPWPRGASITAGGMLLAYLVTMLVHRHWAFVVIHGTAGFFSAAVFSLAMTILSDRREAARSFGIATAMQAAFQVVAVMVGPALLRVMGLNGVAALLAALGGLGLLLAQLLPTHGRAVVPGRLPAGLLKPTNFTGLAGLGLFTMNVGAYWTYIELIGQSLGILSDIVATCVAAAAAVGVLGGVAAGLLGDRFGKIAPLVFAGLLTSGAVLLLIKPLGVRAFFISGVMYFFAWNYSLAYQYAIINTVDATGRIVAITQAFAFLGAAAGAGMAGSYVRPGDYRAITWIVIITVWASFAMFALTLAVGKSSNATRGTATGPQKA